MHSLNNKVALINGGTTGIGLTVAKNFVDTGATVIITGRRDATQAASDIGAHFRVLDVTDEQAVKDLVDAVAKEFGNIDILVNNAGIAEDVGFIDASPTDFMKRCLDVNVMGVYYALKYAPSFMNDGGSIINTGSAAGSRTTMPGNSEYAGSKAAVAYITRSVALELAPRAIRVNAICPAIIAGTGMMAPDDGSDESKFLGSLTALGRMGRQDEITGIYNFLASDSASFITGQEICVDGGLSAGIGLPMLSAMEGESD
jgi:NAD(P)-dependent dehydrogenase (short-subunit alcohol dehydrogenase family)